jgi:diguanylate cyclase
MKPLNILIVEDDVITATDLEDCLEKHGHGVCAIVNSSKDAVKTAGRHKPDVVLMDINLQGKMEGLPAAHEIYSTWGVPVIFTSGYLNVLKDLPEENKHFAYISKPFDEEALIAAIESITSNNHRHR